MMTSMLWFVSVQALQDFHPSIENSDSIDLGFKGTFDHTHDHGFEESHGHEHGHTENDKALTYAMFALVLSIAALISSSFLSFFCSRNSPSPTPLATVHVPSTEFSETETATVQLGTVQA